MTYADILDIVWESGRISFDGKEDPDNFWAEVEAEIAYEASERIESGELEGIVEDAVDFALSHINA
jgi:hypothetical protein